VAAKRRNRTMPKYLLTCLAALVLAGLIGVRVETIRFEREIAEKTGDLLAVAADPGPSQSVLAATEKLPPPVRRYLRHAVPEGRAMIRRVRIEQDGAFRAEAGAEWQAFRALQHVTTSPPGFVWDASIGEALPIHVMDAYLRGSGRLRAKLLATFVVADAAGPEVNSGQLSRYLAEAIWYPSALLPSDRLHWSALDNHSAIAELRDRGTKVFVTFHFGGDDQITGISAQRYYTEAGRQELREWVAWCGDYFTQDGFRIPRETRVAWKLPSGEFEYFRGRVQGIEYEYR
jgi:hypothetical protein